MSNVGQSNIFSDASEYNTLAFVIARATEKMQTVSIVQVKAVNTGAQTVDVQVLVNLVTGSGQSIPNGIISARPYYRAQGGGNAIILDPVVGDIGVMVFTSRDSSAVIAAKGLANPGSQRKFSWSDGVYFGGILNGAPTQYIQFLAAGGGVTIHSPGDITLDSPLTNVTGDLVVDGDTTVDGTSTLTGLVTAVAGLTSTGPIAGTSAVFTGSVTASSFIGGGGGGGGTVTSVATGTGLTGGPITTTGTIALANTAVTPGAYTLADITIDAQGRITAAANGSAGTGTVTSVGISTPGLGVVVGGGPITTAGTLTVDLSSSAYAALALAATALQSISIATGTGLTGGPLGASGSTVALANTAVTAGSYTYASLTVDAQGRITAAASGTAPPAAANPTATVSGSAVNGSAATFMRSDAAPALANTAVTAGSYTTANITVDAQGRITAASSGSAAIGVPGTIPDLTLWWESDNILGASGAIINRLQDRTPWLGGGGVVAGNSTGTVAIDSTLLNSLPVLKWPNSQAPGTYTLPITLPVLVPGATIFIVAKGVTATGTQAIIGGTASGALALYLVGTSGTAKIALAKTQVAVFTPSTTAWTPGAWFQANATFVSASGAYAYRQARATAGSGTSATTGISASTGIIGSDGGASPLNASLAVLIVYNRVLTSTEITNVENYINAKWGV